MKLKNKTAIITGGNQGFGLEVAKSFVKEGANVVLAARDYDKLLIAKNLLKKEAYSDIEIIKADVASVTDNEKVRDLAIAKYGTIDILVANAGVYGPKGGIEEVDWDDWSSAIDINLKGVVLSCRAVIPTMKANRNGKIIILSGGGATKPMPNLSAYAVSKAGVVRFGETLAGELKDHKIDVNCIAPGALNTRLLYEILEAGPEKVGVEFYAQAVRQKETGGTSFDKGTGLCVYLAADVSNGISGKLISAVWDPWESLSEHKDDLNNLDIYTLRRIVPEDRGKNWS